jgi:hypothetical protein
MGAMVRNEKKGPETECAGLTITGRLRRGHLTNLPDLATLQSITADFPF